ncbi:hypothetical protein BDV95DRAFT_555855 [Massariosphaeria phaeospora]|uniref:Uncharacterized protein n=1 Tax=Massariosphaeria phaeospora TaxID=100035 RepID=A0A7C8IJ77_9PLEO|nr:hypothetical protein BDV95DRAFT_555855 [Massariosphaeria phaeospora]
MDTETSNNATPTAPLEQAPVLQESLFSTLPGELRNRIYELVLTASSPLRVTHVNKPTGNFILSADEMSLEEEERDIDEDIVDHKNPHKVSSLGIEYNKDVTLKIDPYVPKVDKASTLTLFNPFCQVSRLLRFETQDLELRLNNHTLTFSHKTGRLFTQKYKQSQIVNFVACVPSARLHYVHKIVVRASNMGYTRLDMADNPMHTQLPQLVDFCKRNPHIEMHYVFPNFSYKAKGKRTETRFLDRGLEMVLAVQGVDLFPVVQLFPNLYGTGNWRDGLSAMTRWGRAVRWRRYGKLDKVLKGVKNFRFYPDEIEVDDEFRRYVALNDDGGALAVRYAQEWVEHGISAA